MIAREYDRLKEVAAKPNRSKIEVKYISPKSDAMAELWGDTRRTIVRILEHVHVDILKDHLKKEGATANG